MKYGVLKTVGCVPISGKSRRRLAYLVLLGCVAIRTGQYLEWDGAAMRFTGSNSANSLVKPDYQNGWKLL